ncbi:MAG: BMP family protein [Sphingomonadales bacterium]
MFKRIKKLGLGLALVSVVALFSAAPVSAKDFKVVVLYQIGGKFDRSFNEAAFRGAKIFRRVTRNRFAEFEPTDEAQFEPALRRFAEEKFDLIVAIGIPYAQHLRKVAAEFPDQNFTSIDGLIDLPNVQSILFKEHEGSFLVGMLAAMKARKGTIGFIGGMDVPLIRRFAVGYAEGARHVNPRIKLIESTVGTDEMAWKNPDRGAELALDQFERGAEVIFAAAGGSGLGVLHAAHDAGKLAIGVDSNQNRIHPGFVLTSMVKRVDLAVSETMTAAVNGTWKPGVTVLGLRENGVDYTLDDDNRALITEEMKSRVEEAKRQIVAGEIVVTDAMSTAP